jgi:hypothetical protein
MMLTDLQDCGFIQAENRRNEFCSELLVYITKPIYYIVTDLVNALVTVLFRHLYGGTEDNHEKSVRIVVRDSKLESPKCKSETLLLSA